MTARPLRSRCRRTWARVPYSTNAAKLKFGNDSNLTTYYAVAETGFDKSPPMTDLRNPAGSSASTWMPKVSR